MTLIRCSANFCATASGCRYARQTGELGRELGVAEVIWDGRRGVGKVEGRR